MKAPAFWFRREGGWAQTLLSPASLVYGGIAGRRFAQRARHRAPIPVICVGNPTVGGAGKTPTCLRIARMLRAAGRRPVFLTRGYGGSERGPLLVEDRHTSAEVGDEALLLAATAPTVVSPDRAAGARLATEHGDVIVMDDGLQNPSLHKDLALLVLDGEAGVGNGRVFPAGPLRLPLKDQIERAHGLVVVGEGDGADGASAMAEREGVPVLRARLAPTDEARTALRDARVYAFAGIGRPEKFFRTIEECGGELAGTWAFADHHPFTAAEAAEILNQARRLEAVPVTTEKDLARLGGEQPQAVRELRETARALPVELELDDEAAPTLYGLVAAALSGGLEEHEIDQEASPASRSST